MLYNDYIELYKKYREKYGPKTAIFLMVGSFYELYDTQHKHTGETQTNIREIADILGIQISIKKLANIPPETDIIFAGFPDYSIHKWAGKLTSLGWTVVVVDQIKNKHGDVNGRVISRILSPSTHIENISSIDIPYVFSIFFHQQLSQPPLFGAGALDLTTGTTITYSGIASGRPDIWTVDELVQMMSIFQPKELLIYWKSPYPIPDEYSFRRIFGLLTIIPIHLYEVTTLGTFSNELACTEYLQKIYSIQSLLPPKTYLGLRSDQEQIALLYLLQFAEEHYPSITSTHEPARQNILKSFHRNEPWIPQSRLICGNHTLTQLQITGSNPNETVIGLFDKCITSMGKRAIRDRILSPYSDSYKIKSRLNEVQEYMEWPVQKTKQLETQLRFMFDLPRLHRKLLCGLITSQDISGLFQTYSAINNIIISVTPDTLLKEPFSQDEWAHYNKVFKTHFVENKSTLTSDDITSFNPDTYPDIGNTEQEIDQNLKEFQILRSEIAESGGVQKDTIHIESHGKEPYGFKGSTATIKQLKKNISKLPAGIKISELKSGGWIDCTKLQQLNTKIQKLREKLVNLVNIHLIDACKTISDAGNNIWYAMECWISHIDCTQCIGRISKEKGFACPIIEQNNEDQGNEEQNSASFEIEQLRHPLVESSSSRISYVKHNVSLGTSLGTTSNDIKTNTSNDIKSNGWLVYGMNASGKSTLMKAVGVCILLAQAGCFVPAKSMKLKPFQAIYTRILNQDNLFAGLSSFAVEMSELRDILKNANANTLVLGDELCAGTESISAQSLVASSIQWLSSRGAKFIFATHLHGLVDILPSEYKDSVRICHLHVEYDPMTKKLIYDRSLRDGSGSTLYGLEVARAMDLPFEFIEHALQNRHRIVGSKRQEDTSNSVWNKEIIKRECEICKTQIYSELEVHHIVPRASATNNILNDGSHMNDKRNLIVICKKCHDKVHADILEIGPLQTTSNGPERIIINKKENIIINKKEENKEDEHTHQNMQQNKEEDIQKEDIQTQQNKEDNIQKEEYIQKEKKEDKIKPRRSKWSEDEMAIIKDTLHTYSSLSLKSIRAYLNSKHSISISEGVLSKIRREK
jgi:DNA mismatch repair protein MutS